VCWFLVDPIFPVSLILCLGQTQLGHGSAWLDCKYTKSGGNWSDLAIAQRIKQVTTSIVPWAGILITSVKWLVAANLQILPWIESSINIRLIVFFLQALQNYKNHSLLLVQSLHCYLFNLSNWAACSSVYYWNHWGCCFMKGSFRLYFLNQLADPCDHFTFSYVCLDVTPNTIHSVMDSTPYIHLWSQHQTFSYGLHNPTILLLNMNLQMLNCSTQHPCIQ
jgi:hypothetical protein